MDFEKICMMFSMQEPFYGIILSSMERVEEPACGTIAVGRRGNVFKLFYNPDFINKFNTDTVLELLKHECLHLALNHFTAMKDKEEAGESHDLCNVAIDLEANCYINRDKVQKEAGGCWCEDFGFKKNEGSREYFNLLKKKLQDEKQQAQAQQPQKPCNGGIGGIQERDKNKLQQQNNRQKNEAQQQGQPGGNADTLRSDVPGQPQPAPSITDDDCKSLPKGFDDHSRWPTCESEQETQELQQVIDTMLDFAAEETEKRQGTIPGEIAGRIDKIRKKPKPVADWRRYFRRYLGNEFTELIRKSKKRESRRFPDAAGNRHQRKSHILVAIDTSGSVCMPEYREFFGQIMTLKEKASFHVLECDTVIQHEYDFKGRIPEILHGHGGTDFQPPVDYFNKHRREYDALIYFTDGDAPIPDDTPKETLWVVSSQGNHDRKRYQINGAKAVFIKPTTN
jgi:predicted metal-dependent peptidase